MADRLKTDILVVGAGPAGSVTARFAAEKGARVTLIERRPEIGVPVRCGELMPSCEEIKGFYPSVPDLDSLLYVPKDLRVREMEGIRLIDPKDRCTEVEFTGYTTDRDRYDQYLAGEAVKAGAELIKGCAFKNIRNGIAETSEGDIEYKVIIGADGPSSRVARSLDLPKNMNPYPAVTAQAKGDFEPYVTMYFGGIAPGAYSWIIPKAGCANVGVGFSPKFADGTLDGYFEKFKNLHDFEITSDKLNGKYVPSEGPIARTVAGNGMVVGDAAGHVISVSGGGLPQAVIGGRICGQVAADHIKEGRALADYETEWRRAMLKPLKTAAFNKKLADTFAFRSERSTTICMSILGKRRLTKLIKCKRLFP